MVTAIDPDHHSARQVVVKFHEGTRIQLRAGRLTFDPTLLTEEDRARMRRNVLTDEQVLADVDRANALIFSQSNVTVTGLFARSEDARDGERATLEADVREELADLDLYFMIVFSAPNVALAESTISQLNALRSVEISYAEPIPAEPAADLAPNTTISVVPDQGYLKKAPGGIDADWSWRLPGGRGVGMRLVDHEGGWTNHHEDLPGTYFFQNGWNSIDPGDRNHGAAVLGVLAAADNGYGATGIVPDVAIGLSSPWRPTFLDTHSTAAAIDNASAALRRGDVLVIEQHYLGYWEGLPPGVDRTASCNPDQFGFLPMEGVQAVFDMVRRATAKGIIVVEAAGNGSMNLDDPFYKGRFDRNVRDSRAIMVGAGLPNTGNAECFTNFGSRVDLQGWGSNVATVGYGAACGDPVRCPADPSLRANGGDPRQFYTKSFSGTSSATPIVAGAAVAVNGSRLADGLPLFNSTVMRGVLRTTGTPQPAADAAIRQIGPLPDLRKALPAVAGRVDEVRADGVARGWAFHSAQPQTSIQVHFYVDGPSDAGTFAGIATARESRPDVNTFFSITGSHGFEFRIPDIFRDGATHTLFAYGINPTSGGANRELQQVLSFNLPKVNGAPNVTIVTPSAGARYRWGYGFLLSATANDAEDGSLPVRWTSDRDGWLGTGTTALTVGYHCPHLSYGKHRITASATDSAGLPAAASVEIEITNDLPTISIVDPANGSEFATGQSVRLHATSDDFNEPGQVLPDGSVVWSSSLLSGALGTGHTLTVTLPAGTHALTVTGTDRGGAVATATVTVVVRDFGDPPPTVVIDNPNEDISVWASSYDPSVGRGYVDVRVSGLAYDEGTDRFGRLGRADVTAHWYGTINGSPYASFGWTEPERATLLCNNRGGLSECFDSYTINRHNVDLRLYTSRCDGFDTYDTTHTIALTGTDAGGNRRTSVRRITVRCPVLN
jgi:hypothetical protein